PAPVAEPIHDGDVGGRCEGVLPGGDRTPPGLAPELGVALAHQLEGVLVEPHPDVQPVLLDAVSGTAARRTLAAEAPADLVDRDLEASFERGAGELEGGGHGGAAAADDGDLRGPDHAGCAHAGTGR